MAHAAVLPSPPPMLHACWFLLFRVRLYAGILLSMPSVCLEHGPSIIKARRRASPPSSQWRRWALALAPPTGRHVGMNHGVETESNQKHDHFKIQSLYGNKKYYQNFCTAEFRWKCSRNICYKYSLVFDAVFMERTVIDLGSGTYFNHKIYRHNLHS